LKSGERKGKPGDGYVRLVGHSQHALGMVRRGVVPDQPFGHVRTHVAARFEEGDAVILAAALAHQFDQLPGRRAQRPMDHPPPVAPTDHHLALLAGFGLTGAQRRKLGQGGFVAEPHLASRRQHRVCLLYERPFLAS
jgi:hypothetical protein